MTQSPTIGALAAALAKAQGSMKHAAKDAANPFFKSKYADLASIWEACRAALAANGLSVTQIPDGGDAEHMTLSTTIMHSSGEWISGNYPIRPIKNDPQGIGSAITYARRYALSAMVGVVADEDDDGEAALGRGNNAKQTSAGVVAAKKSMWTDDQKKEAGGCRASLMEFGKDAEAEFNATWKVMQYDTPSDVIDELMKILNKWRSVAGGK